LPDLLLPQRGLNDCPWPAGDGQPPLDSMINEAEIYRYAEERGQPPSRSGKSLHTTTLGIRVEKESEFTQ